MAEKKVLRPPYSLCVRWLHKRFPKQGAKKLYYVHTSTTYIPACPSFRFFFECVCFCLKIENLAAAFWLQAIYIPGAQPFTSFMAYPLQDINLVSSFMP